MGFFFFKQKTAYEMRISDWSSDVCSSDLVASGASFTVGAARQACRAGVPRGRQGAAVDARQGGHVRLSHRRTRRREDDRYRVHLPVGHQIQPGDRKSVVSGKSVSVRVDLGGRRIIKKKKKTKNTIK